MQLDRENNANNNALDDEYLDAVVEDIPVPVAMSAVVNDNRRGSVASSLDASSEQSIEMLSPAERRHNKVLVCFTDYILLCRYLYVSRTYIHTHTHT